MNMSDKAREIMQKCEIALIEYGPNAGKINVRAKNNKESKRIHGELVKGMWRAELEEIKAHLKAEKDAKDAEYKARQKKIDAIEGIKEIRAAIDDMERYHDELLQMMEDGDNDGSRPPKRPETDIAALRSQYPRAAAYLKAESYSYAAHYAKAKAGRAALEKIINDVDFDQAIADMEREWSDYCDEHIWD